MKIETTPAIPCARVRLAPLLAFAVVLASAGCGPPPDTAEANPPWTTPRKTPKETIAAAIKSMEREDYSTFPTILSLTYHLFLLEHAAAREETEAMTDEDFERTLALLRALREIKPQYSQGGKLATFTVPGFKLPGDRFHMIQQQGKWYFLVD